MRHQDWVSRLWREMEACASEPFVYGRTDCCMFVARCIDAMTGSSLVDQLSRCYQDQRSAKRFILAEGGIELAICGFLGDSTPGANARRGDACLVEVEDGLGVGICIGPTIAVKNDGSLTPYPISSALAHWRV